ncbi:Translation elongation factor 1 beta [Marasmius crinis-equi]|uniref:Translation elongation factor 1 beta n=1 Tax=Marasmius crinis-equi TaxID=585013 RepID=A0ABR3FFH5_9AGAR
MSVDLKKLEEHLQTRSYIEGYTPSQADVHVFKAIANPDSSYPNVTRWHKHIASYAAEHASLPGSSKAGEAFFGSGAAPAAAAAGGDDDDDIDLFGSDEEEDAEAERVKAERVAAYNAKKANKPKTIAKSVVTLDVKPWDDETDMEALEKAVRSIEQDGLVWGASKLVPIGYGIRKLQMTLVVEDEKVSTDELQEKIAEFEDYVQSSDVAAMQNVLELIAFLVTPFNAPTSDNDLSPLLLTCSSIYNSLSPAAAPHLYARIFRAKFDTETLFRRLRPYGGLPTDSILARELVLRYRLLRRARRRSCLPTPQPNNLHSDDLHVALRMTLESDGLNGAHIASTALVWSCIDYLFAALRVGGGVERKALLPGYLQKHCGQNSDVAIALWLVVLNWGTADICKLPEEMRKNLRLLLSPLVHSSMNEDHSVKLEAKKIASRSQSERFWEDHARPTPLQVVDLGDLYSCPPAASAAILLTLALYEAKPLGVPTHLPANRAEALSKGQSGPTMEDHRTMAMYRTLLFNDYPPQRNECSRTAPSTPSLRHDPSFFNKKLETLAHRGRGCTVDDDENTPALESVPVPRAESSMYGYISSHLEGVWEGHYMMESIDTKDDSQSGCRANEFGARKALQASLSLYFAFGEGEESYSGDRLDALTGSYEPDMSSDNPSVIVTIYVKRRIV